MIKLKKIKTTVCKSNQKNKLTLKKENKTESVSGGWVETEAGLRDYYAHQTAVLQCFKTSFISYEMV